MTADQAPSQPRARIFATSSPRAQPNNSKRLEASFLDYRVRRLFCLYDDVSATPSKRAARDHYEPCVKAPFHEYLSAKHLCQPSISRVSRNRVEFILTILKYARAFE